ncbi:E3 ubiquitin-protein ligase HUWE1 [Leptonychotes weddellii]|uniref:E3 ubiquitin-protein ligase HUWE1 n=1 Tax=Leptonychotes weddellii TaxID=9713 RepID=A0A7F8QGB4_LEPWE|nr:E3 ubiquitin-protein ligase HUWE1 [Leptonychotes weddellii]
MKVDRTKLKKTPTEAPADCRALIDKLKVCNDEQLLLELQQIKTWNIGKCELYHWVDLLDRFDGILADAGQTVENMSWMLVCDRPEREQLKMLLLAVLNFTALLIEYSFSRHLYSSIEHLTTLLASSDMQVVLAVLNLLYVFSKRSNYITRLGSDKRTPLLTRLQHLAESWGGKENGFGLAECCRDLHMMKYPPSATTLHFEFYADPGAEVKIEKRTSSNTLHYIHIEQLDKISESPSEIMESLTKMYSIPKDKQMLLFTHIRLAHGFSNHRKRLQAVQARLHAISILVFISPFAVYSNALQESANSILYNGLIEELVDVLQITDKQLMEIKAASLRTLTSIVHLERTPKLSSIIDCTGTASYHGFLPVLVRNCIQAMIDPSMDPYPHQFATALFSFLYHLASYDAGGEALVSCGMMEALLKVIKFLGDEQDQITFVTRAVRVVDLITNLDMAAFQSHSGLSIFIYRLEHEVDLCRKECPFVIKPKIQRPSTTQEGEEMETDMDVADVTMETSPGSSISMEHRLDVELRASSSSSSTSLSSGSGPGPRPGVQCIPQRAALLKSMLNFLKKAIQDPAFSDGIRHVMDGSLPTSLKHIISNAEYYGPSLFLLATEVVTVFVFQEPSLLSSLQDNGLTDVMLHALLIKDVPATREVLGSLPNVFSALCLNARGLQSFVQCQPFERLFKVLLSPDYLPAMRRRRSSDPLGDTASNLGSAVDELMRHQPTLKTDATTAIIKLLEEICNLGRDPKYICQKPSIQKADGTATAPPPRSNHAAEEASSEDEEEEEVQAMQSFNSTQQNETEPNQQVVGTEERIPIPLMDYILNVMKFVESILSNNTTDDHCQEFVNQKGLLPLVTILGLPNLPIDFPTSAACQAVAGVCKSILTLSHEPKVLQEGLLQLDSILSSLEPLHRPIESPGGSVLLRELACAGNVADATLSAQATPLLHALTAAHAYIMMFVHTCRVGQSEIRSISVNQWGSQLGLSVLSKLSQLYCSLVWESTVLLSLCTPNSLPSGCEFGQADMQKLVPKDEKAGTTQGGKRSDGEQDGAAASMDASTQGLLEGIGLDGDTLAPMETDEPTASDSKGKSKITPAMAARIKQIKPLLSASSRLGRALAELFGLLVKLCVGSPVRQRRSHHAASTTTAPTPAARSTASALTKLLTKGLSWQPPPYTPTPRFRLTFFICSVGFTSPMLFDERKYPYHLMLQKFLCSGGHNALFETFNWALSMGGKVPVAEGLEHSDLPDGTGEFLDAWLMLVEKMVNPTTVLESPHSLPAKLPGGVQNFPQFSALRFLVVTQKAAFTCIKNLWNRKPLKVYGGRMAESMLAILCHILRGEPVIRERLSKEKEGSRGEEDTGQEEGGSRREPQVNQQQLQQLMDMGFTREHAMEALLNTSTMEQATEYLLTHPPPIMGGVVRDLSMSEEDQMMRAIAMSLGQDIPMDQRAESPEEVACRKEEEERKAREKQEEEEAKCLEKFQDADPLEQDELHTFTDTMLPGCFHLLDELPDTVYRVCDLIMTAIKRNGADYRDMILKQVVNQVWEAADVLIKAALPLTTSDTKTVSEWISQMATLPQASNLATRILLLTLLFEELKLPCAWVVESSGILNVLIKLLEVVQPCLQAAKEQKEVQTPKWITPVLLLIDFYEKTAISSKRRAQMTKYLQSNNNNWRWFDDRSGRWCSYSASNNSTIDSAWKSGETSVRFTAGRRRYTVQFTTMVQVNEETGNRRPVMLTLLRVPRLNKNSKNSNGQELEKTLEESKEMDIKRKENKANDTPLALESTNTEKETSLEETKVGEILIQGLTEDMVTVLIRACVSMLGVPVDPDTLHATLRLCLRLTRDHKYAMMFAELKSTRMILNLTQSSGFNGFTPLVTLLLRHIIEDPCTLRHTMEKVVRSAATSGAGSTTSGVVSGSLGSREINYILRVLGPAACRNPDIFTEVANCCIRIALPAPRGSGTASDDEFENLRIKGPNAVQLVKTTPLKPSPLPVIPDTIKEVIYDMLNALAAYHAPEEAEKSDPKPGGMTQEVGQLLQDMGDDVYQQYRSLTRQSSDFDTQSGFSINSQVFAADGASTETSTSGTSQGEASTPEESRDGKKEKEGDRASEEGKQKGKGSKPLMPTSTILRLLAELVRSYVGIATLIANYSYTVGQSELIKEDCSVLAFVLDHLLPHTQNAEDKDTPALARLFLASLAAAGSGTDAQVALVNEVKAALGRALAMAESTEKHARPPRPSLSSFCRQVFPSHFTQQRTKETNCESDRERGSKQACSPCSSQSTSSGICTDFWDLLVKLDNMNVSRKGKNSVKSVPVSAGGEGETSPYSLEASPLGQLMNMLSHPVIRRSSLLTEKLLRLLSLISIALPENKVSEAQANSGSSASSTTVATSTTSTTTTTAASSTPTPPAATTPVTSAPALVAATAISTIAVAASTTVTTPTTATTTVSTSAATKASKSPAKLGDGGSSSADFKMVSSGLTENQLQLSVEVLTSHSCSEEGLEDAANVLLQLSRGDPATRDTVLKLLLNGARHLGYTLCKQIGTLLAELREYNLEQQRRAQCETLSPDGLPEEQPQTTKLKGKMQSRFDMAENVVIVASQKRPLGGRELQLPSMSMLTSKTSTQKFFLRVLQVIIQLRDDTRRANKKAKQTGRLGSSGLGSASSIQAAVRQLEAEADAIIQMVREGQRARRQQQAATSESSQSEASVRREESPMDVDQPSPSAQDTQSIGSDGTPQGEKEERPPELPLLSEQLSLDELWDMLGECLKELEESHDQHAVLVLQPAVEAFFLVHATERESKPPVRDTRESQLAHIKDEPPPLSPAPLTPATPSSLDPFFSREPSSMHISSSLPPDTQKFLRFAETHRTVLNQILRQSTTHLADGPFAVLVDYIRVLDFDVKRKYFRQELERLDEGLRKEDMAVHVRRDHVFEDSYRELHRKSPEEMKNRLYIVFEGEEGQDAGGLLREWYMIISREMFNPMYALFRTSPGDRVTYTINPSSHCNPNHLSYFKFVGRIVAKAVYDNRLLECYFTRSFYKHILGKSVRYTDMESEDYHFYQGLVYLLENDVSTLGYDLTFSTEVQEFGVCEVRDLKPNGANILVTEENKKEYVHLVCQMRMTGAIRKQLAAFLEGFYEIIPKRLISIFTEQELELLISGLPTIDIDDLKSNTEYHKYQSNSIQIQWFWRALRSFDQADRAKFLQFVTGTSKVPLQGFAALEGMNGIQKFQIHRDDRSTDRLPSAHTCFNQLDLPAYESFEKLRHMLLLAIQECSEGFGLA